MEVPDRKTIRQINSVAAELKKIRNNKIKCRDMNKLDKLIAQENILKNKMMKWPLIYFGYIKNKNK